MERLFEFTLDVLEHLKGLGVNFLVPSSHSESKAFKWALDLCKMKQVVCPVHSMRRLWKQKKANVGHFIKKMGSNRRVGTHVAQRNHKDAEEEATQFMMMMHQKMAQMDPDDVINMDKTSIL